jgi:hypothetical protein
MRRLMLVLVGLSVLGTVVAGIVSLSGAQEQGRHQDDTTSRALFDGKPVFMNTGANMCFGSREFGSRALATGVTSLALTPSLRAIFLQGRHSGCSRTA